MMIRAIIVEDSRLARVELKELLRAHPEIQVMEEAASASQALQLIQRMQPDLLFMDIHLPGASGLEILAQLKPLPMVIFTTAFEQYALQSYDYYAVDYLLKPIVPERLDRAVQKALANFTSQPERRGRLAMHDRIFIKDQHKTWLVPLHEIRYIESKGNYAQVFFAHHSPLMLKSLQQLEDTLSQERFIRVNRQQLVNLDHVVHVSEATGNRLKLTMSNGVFIEVSRRQVAKFKSLFDL